MIFGTGLLALGGLMLWTGLTGQNGFAELGKLFSGEPAFVRGEQVPGEAGGGGPFTGDQESIEESPSGGGSGGGSGGAW